MSRKKAKKSIGGRFKRLLGWTVLLAIVFSAGLITGERLVRKQNLDPLVSVDEQVDRGEVADEPARSDDNRDRERSFDFFDKLTNGDEVTLSAQRPGAAGAPENEAPKQDEASNEEVKDENPKEDAPSPEEAPADGADEEASAEESKESKTDREPGDAPADEKQPEDDVDEGVKAEVDDDQGATDPDVNEEAIPEEGSKESQGDAGAARYTLQVAAHPDLESARGQMKKLKKLGLEPHVVTSSIPDKGKFYRVRVGKFEAMEEAESVQKELRKDNSLSTFVSPL